MSLSNTSRRAQIFMHVPFEGPAHILDWLNQNQFEHQITNLFNQDALPNLDDLDMLIIMGGPMSINDESDYPWLADEKAFIKAAIDAGKIVIGICLGAQLIASALGANVYANAESEIGWFPLKATTIEDDPVFNFPAFFTCLHWHGETFDLPEGATLLASSPGCVNQAFQYGPKVMGLQFHPEATEEMVTRLVDHCSDELVEGRYIQNAERILGVNGVQYKDANLIMDSVLVYLTQS